MTLAPLALSVCAHLARGCGGPLQLVFIVL